MLVRAGFEGVREALRIVEVAEVYLGVELDECNFKLLIEWLVGGCHGYHDYNIFRRKLPVCY